MERPIPSLGQVFAVLEELRAEGVVRDYALVGAVAALFWSEPTATFDLDLAVALGTESADLVSLGPLLDELGARGFAGDGEHVWIHGVPVRFLPGDDGIWGEAVREAVRVDYEGVGVRVARPEHLVALCWLAPSAKRRLRATALLESPAFDRMRLAGILSRHGLRDLSDPAAR